MRTAEMFCYCAEPDDGVPQWNRADRRAAVDDAAGVMRHPPEESKANPRLHLHHLVHLDGGDATIPL